ncbi:UDP-3-O-(3-hydroxymyristoyl)glucosamine N-acyltransferase [Endozoicomonas acroporae]|uniref:UDP-3-O-(3-hydroxymyristoyl)glucosamine N-acyltransferase n=1 Tax=Endozoicomonas acroporae TaxID=1701104 RepID=UPI0013D8413B|nr:UDP-3-O-(3-hydroxymyristoyl)glucosamine N-acyltransferase [Endozoicomonas acroporae]
MLNALDIAQQLHGRLFGDGNITVDSICPVSASRPDALAIVLSKHDLKFIDHCQAAIVVGPAAIGNIKAPVKIVIDALDVTLLNHLLRYYKAEKYHLLDQENVSTIPGVFIGKHARIGKGCHFMPGVRIHNGAVIGDNVAIHANTVIKEGTVVGNNVTIDSNNSIGNFSFEYMLNSSGEYERLESIGRVIIEDNVDIGCNNTIDRGTLGDTVIGRGSKIDNLCQIGHDCRIGQHCLIISQSGVAGHTILGNRVTVHGQSAIAGHLHIGDGTVIQGKSGVSRSCPPRSKLFGYPARDSHQYMKSLATLNALSKGKAPMIPTRNVKSLKPGREAHGEASWFGKIRQKLPFK